MNVENVRVILERTFEMPVAESDAQIVLDRLRKSVEQTACRLGENAAHIGPFLVTPEGLSKCDSCGCTW